jgi:hypothetical protein
MNPDVLPAALGTVWPARVTTNLDHDTTGFTKNLVDSFLALCFIIGCCTIEIPHPNP